MTLISAEDYELFTGSTAPDNFEALHNYVVSSLEDVLGRWLVSQSYNEHIFPISKDGVLYPRATPITTVPAGWRFDNDAVYLIWDLYGGSSEPVNPAGFTDYGIDSGIGAAYTSDGLNANSIDYFLVQGIDITYTGGYTPYGSGGLYTPYNEVQANPTFQLSSDLPVGLAKAIAWGIHTKSNAENLALPRGIQSMNIAGEFSATLVPGTILGPDGYPVPRKLKAAQDLGGQCLTLAAPYRRLRK